MKRLLLSRMEPIRFCHVYVAGSGSILGKRHLSVLRLISGRGKKSAAMMYESQPPDVWRSSRDLISVRTDKEEPSSRSSGGSKQICKAGTVQYLKGEEGYGEWL